MLVALSTARFLLASYAPVSCFHTALPVPLYKAVFPVHVARMIVRLWRTIIDFSRTIVRRWRTTIDFSRTIVRRWRTIIDFSRTIVRRW